MKHTFYLKEPKSTKESLILFSCYFKDENKKFVYSTGENILPSNWDSKNHRPFLSGDNKSNNASSIKLHLDKFSAKFSEKEGLCKIIKEPFTSKILKLDFDIEFQRVSGFKNTFFDYFDIFVSEKVKGKEWSASTIKRYQNIKNILLKFEKEKKFHLTFSKIDNSFHREFTSFCMDDLEHINNTYSRNLGLFKTFMFWAKKNKFTFNDTFIEFKKVERVLTNQIALTEENLESIMNFEFENKRLEKVRDVFIFSCVTGFRFGELASIRKSNVTDDYILLKEDKDHNKPTRKIPLTAYSRFILKKYSYELPLIANQKQNDYLKEVFKTMEFNKIVEKVTTKGKENIREEMYFYERISTHTARRTFITMMKKAGYDFKLIAAMTGHRDMKTLNQYYQVDEPEKIDAMDKVFNLKLNLKIA